MLTEPSTIPICSRTAAYSKLGVCFWACSRCAVKSRAVSSSSFFPSPVLGSLSYRATVAVYSSIRC